MKNAVFSCIKLYGFQTDFSLLKTIFSLPHLPHQGKFDGHGIPMLSLPKETDKAGIKIEIFGIKV